MYQKEEFRKNQSKDRILQKPLTFNQCLHILCKAQLVHTDHRNSN